MYSCINASAGFLLDPNFYLYLTIEYRCLKFLFRDEHCGRRLFTNNKRSYFLTILVVEFAAMLMVGFIVEATEWSLNSHPRITVKPRWRELGTSDKIYRRLLQVTESKHKNTRGRVKNIIGKISSPSDWTSQHS